MQTVHTEMREGKCDSVQTILSFDSYAFNDGCCTNWRFFYNLELEESS